ncbi:MAG: tripartite tricarboxylate transporter substrate binding protein [Acetobacteraceae bacterium]|nr:tripartite tricarboxylate transporter substrate binding protein [Acetobacteraceae bacterium]
MRRRRPLLLGLVVAAPLSAVARGSSGGAEAAAPAPWRPSRPIRLVVPVAAGGSQDAVARILARPMSDALGQLVVVENLPGAAGNLGFRAVARARPDGHTLLAGSDGLSINKSLFPRLDFDPVEGFAAVSWVVRVPQVLVVRADRSWAREGGGFDAFLRDARRAAPAVGTTGIGSLAHLLGEEIQEAVGVRWTHVPYRGGAPAVTDVLARATDAALVNIGAASGQVRAGALHGLFVSSAQRVAALPEVPTIIETGPLREGVVGWHGIVAPAGTAPAVLATLDAAVQAALARPEVVARLIALGVEPVSERPERLAAVIRSDAERWGAVIRRARIAPG